ncbi:alkaline shock response membrane anchor protein AmaP [Streptomyces sp. MS1.HAVA.3]|uniref:Alkaline shock response membrane anchor protein AmaP n=1 Tax=Streptomyces caledonius TaxID=3134107 RepID=A0ABU8UCL3_9ACTN
MLGAVNRTLLALVGAILLAAGVVLLTASWPLHGRHAPLLAEEARRRYWHAEDWWWWAVLSGLGLCVVLALWWLLSQVRRPRLPAVVVDTGDGAYALLRGRALEEVVAAEVGAVEGVAGCRAALRRRRGRPRCGSPWNWNPTRSPPTPWPPWRARSSPTSGPRRASRNCRRRPASR